MCMREGCEGTVVEDEDGCYCSLCARRIWNGPDDVYAHLGNSNDAKIVRGRGRYWENLRPKMEAFWAAGNDNKAVCLEFDVDRTYWIKLKKRWGLS